MAVTLLTLVACDPKDTNAGGSTATTTTSATDTTTATNTIDSGSTDTALETAVDNTALTLAKAKAKAELAALQARLAAEDNVEAANQELERIRDNLALAYENTSEEVRAQWPDVQSNFDALGERIQDDTATNLETLGEFFSNLGTELDDSNNQ